MKTKEPVNSRQIGLDWLRKKGRAFDKRRVKVSKHYTATESFPGTPVWWFEFPDRSLTDDASAFLDLLCRVGPGSSEFHHLRVPMGWFLARKQGLGYREDRGVFSLYLSAEKPTLFRELRGTGQIEFAVFKLG